MAKNSYGLTSEEEGPRLKWYRSMFGGNSQVGRKYVIRNLVSCIGKSSYYSTRIPVARSSALPFSPAALSSPPLSISCASSNIEFYFASHGISLGRSRDGIFIQISLDPSSRSSSRDPPFSRGAGIALYESKSLARSFALMPQPS